MLNLSMPSIFFVVKMNLIDLLDFNDFNPNFGVGHFFLHHNIQYII